MIQKIINNFEWTFAKTYENSNPHEYVVKAKCGDEKGFDLLCDYIKNNGHIERFFRVQNIYLSIGKYTYWVVGNVINRRWNDMYYTNDKGQIHKVKNWKELLKEKVM